jgi:nicotinamide riboside kinase
MEQRLQKPQGNIIKIAVTGPESTGKTELASGLARHFGDVWVPEFARDYLNHLNRDYTYDDLEIIAKGQIGEEYRLIKTAKKFLFCDTELSVIKIWSEYKYGKCSREVLRLMQQTPYHLYLLCDTDIPWEYDVLREHPGKGRYFSECFIRELSSRSLPYAVIKGLGAQRLDLAVKTVLKTFSE